MPTKIPVSEKEWQATIVAALQSCGWMVNHTYRGQAREGQWRTATTVVGWPDLICLRQGYILIIEVKGEKGRLTEAQVNVLEAWWAAQAHVWVLRPSDNFQDIMRWIRGPVAAPDRYGW